MKTDIKWCGNFEISCQNKDGRLKWQDKCKNALFNEGEYAILDIALRGGPAPASWYLGLMNNTLSPTPAKDSTLTTLISYELNSGANLGYAARLPINRDDTVNGWPSLIITSGDYQVTSKTVTFSASGNWTDAVRWLFITTNGVVGDTTGLLIALAQLSVDRTIVGGDTLSLTYNIKLT